MITSTITGQVTSGVTLTSDTYTNPVAIASGASVSGPTGVYSAQNWTIENSGTVTGGPSADYSGILLSGGGAVTNAAGGSITGGGFGIDIHGPQSLVENSGAIAGTITAGVYINSGDGTGQVENFGRITGENGFGVRLVGQNEALENFGTIETGGTGAVSVYLHGTVTNKLTIAAGATFGQTVEAYASAANTLDLSNARGAGTISGFGSQYQGFQTITIDSGASWDIAGSISGFAGVTIDGFTPNDRLDLTDVAYNTGDSAHLDNATDVLTIEDGHGGTIGTIQFAGDFGGDLFKLVNDGNGDTFVEDDETPCFSRGTHIRTPSGEVAIEALKIGDRVTVAGGETLPVKWIGRRSYCDWLAIGNQNVQPVLFKAGSLADQIPARDLLVSPEHAMFLDGVLVPARHLVNGISIVKREDMEKIDYFHLELERHAIIFAEGATAESFADDDSRDAFHNADEYRALYPDEPRRPLVQYCAPRVEDGYALDTLRRALANRAARLQPNRKAARTPVQQGYLDRATRTSVEGWAIPPSGDEPVMLAIVVNGAVVGQTFADRYRHDLEAAGFGDGHYSFHFTLPQPLSPELSHRIEVRRESDWTLLHGGPVLLNATITQAAA